jgi:hypothetical protein
MWRAAKNFGRFAGAAKHVHRFVKGSDFAQRHVAHWEHSTFKRFPSNTRHQSSTRDRSRNHRGKNMPPKVKLAKSVRPVRVPSTVSIERQGERIGALREILRWSNKEMAVRTGIPEPTLSQFIYGRKKSIHSIDIYRIAAATGTDANFIIYGNTKCLTALWRQRIKKFGG